MSAQKSDEVAHLAAAKDRGAETEHSVPRVRLTDHYSTGRRLAVRGPVKRLGFVAASVLLCGATAFLAVALAHFLVDGQLLVKRHYESGGYTTNRAYILMGGVAGVATCVLTLMSRLEKSRGPAGFLEEWVEASKEAFVVGIALVIVAFFWRPALVANSNFSRGTILMCCLLLVFMLGAMRSVLRACLLQMRKLGRNLASVVVIGDGPSARSFMDTLEQDGCGYKVVAHVTDTQIEHDIGEVLGGLSSDLPIDEVVITSFAMAPEQLARIISHPGMRNARLRAVPEMFGLPPSKVQIESFGDFPLLTLFENPVRGVHWVVKRAVDLVGASVLLVVMGLPMLVMALAVHATSEGPVLFRQERVGMDGKRFQLLKFRSMEAGVSDQAHRDFMTQLLKSQVSSDSADDDFFKLTDDPRVTAIGHFLRRFSLDELPQLLNVLRGEMSLVGPRPALAYEVDLYDDWQRRRLDVLPGMTGLWQVSGRSRLSPADMLRLDVHYADTWSLVGDLLIILKTVPAILHDNAR